MDEMDEIVQEFLVESHENLDQLDTELMALEQDPRSSALLSSVFRTIHTIKGTSGFLAFSQLEAVTHVGEGLLARLRDGRLDLTPEVTSALLRLVDAVRELLAGIEATGAEVEGDYTDLVADLTRLQDPTSPEAPAEPAEPAEPGEPAAPSEPPAPPAPAVPSPGVPNEAPRLGDVLLQRNLVQPADITAALAAQEAGDSRPLGEILIAHGAVSRADLTAALEVQGEVRRAIADSTIRVDVALLDSLMNLVGELVLTRNQIVQRSQGRLDGDLLRSTHRLSVIAAGLQEGVMRTRMQPIDHVWGKLPRMVRDLSLSLGKSVRVQMEGRDTELDKTLLEAVKDPLTHLVRNSVDHGIETPEERVAAGKPAEGTLRLRAFHEGGQVIVEVGDDGAGIDPDRIRAAAVARRVVRQAEADRLTEREAVALIFEPGFSTADEVTNVSGRGVGMDVVRTNIESINGVIDITSTPGVGTTFRIKIPLTLAIIPALLVDSGGDTYAVPQVNLLELLRLEEGARGLEDVRGATVYRLRGDLLPVVDLREQLGRPRAPGGTTYLVVLQAGERRYGLVVDAVHDTEDIVVKPLGPQLRGLDLFAGATVLGDGEVALILDALALAERAGLPPAGDHRPAPVDEPPLSEDPDHETLLLVELSDGRQVGLPIDVVDRLEEVDLAATERVGAREVVQYRSGVLSLVHLDDVLGSAVDGVRPQGRTPVVVCRYDGALVGLVVRRIRDIVVTSLAVRGEGYGPRLGSAVVAGRVTELVDVGYAAAWADLAPVGVRAR